MSDRATRILLAAVTGLLLLAAVAAVLSVTRQGPEYAEGSPEATVQSYIVAAVAKDGEEAVRHLDPADGCTARHVEQSRTRPGSRVVLRGTSTDGDRATVRLDVVSTSGGPLSTSEWTSQETLELRQVEGEWLVTGTPWPVRTCRPEVSRP
ncbi:hypothetical protein [Ornithinimicrobium pratense]|uniref:Nuclear transport factor 2 family protein n=1 Tax=Ornithinimicrobium pratense TaxID=2593973 RepID=A0A5J6V5A0_9MICO|nr:hypothetical protein [Ornithinimicrobium pratense]QFG68311.1 hypothetical protein FY030_05920 [Ornithinimicrobium pratense]